MTTPEYLEQAEKLDRHIAFLNDQRTRLEEQSLRVAQDIALKDSAIGTLLAERQGLADRLSALQSTLAGNPERLEYALQQRRALEEGRVEAAKAIAIKRQIAELQELYARMTAAKK